MINLKRALDGYRVTVFAIKIDKDRRPSCKQKRMAFGCCLIRRESAARLGIAESGLKFSTFFAPHRDCCAHLVPFA